MWPVCFSRGTKACVRSTPRSALPHLLPPLQSKVTLLKSPLNFCDVARECLWGQGVSWQGEVSALSFSETCCKWWLAPNTQQGELCLLLTSGSCSDPLALTATASGWWTQGSGKPLPRTIAIFFSRKGDKRFIRTLCCFTCFGLPDTSCWKASSPLIIQGVDFHCWWGYIIGYLLPNLFLDHYVECAIAVPCFMRLFFLGGFFFSWFMEYKKAVVVLGIWMHRRNLLGWGRNCC